MKVLITDGENRSSLAVTRSLGRKGHKVVAAGTDPKNLSAVSKYCDVSYRTADPIVDAHAFCDDIIRIVEKEAVEVIMPMTEPAMYLLSMPGVSLPRKVFLASPRWDTLQLVLDKSETMRIARENNVDIPKSTMIDNRADFFSKKDTFRHFPVVVKPNRSRIPTEEGFLKTRVLYAEDIHNLEYLFERENILNYPSLIQETITGPGVGLFTIFDGSQHLVLFSHMRLKEKPPSGGVSVESISIAPDDGVVEASKRLLRAMGWKGVAMVEFKQDRRDGSFKLMEVNGRFWGSLQLAVSCGVDFPCLLIDYLQGKLTTQLPLEYKTDHKLKWPLGMLDHLMLSMRRRQNVPDGGAGNIPRLKLVFEFIKLFEKNCSYDVLDWHDMLPFYHEFKGYIRSLLSSHRR